MIERKITKEAIHGRVPKSAVITDWFYVCVYLFTYSLIHSYIHAYFDISNFMTEKGSCSHPTQCTYASHLGSRIFTQSKALHKYMPDGLMSCTGRAVRPRDTRLGSLGHELPGQPLLSAHCQLHYTQPHPSQLHFLHFQNEISNLEIKQMCFSLLLIHHQWLSMHFLLLRGKQVNI